MNYWLVKTEPSVYSIADLKRDKSTAWTGVRNYQARNFMREMKVGDLVLLYHSNATPSGVVGIGHVLSAAKADPTQFESGSEYFDPKASELEPRWFCPEVGFKSQFGALVSLDELRQNSGLSDLLLLKRGSRLSVIPVSEKHFRIIETLGERGR